MNFWYIVKLSGLTFFLSSFVLFQFADSFFQLRRIFIFYPLIEYFCFFWSIIFGYLFMTHSEEKKPKIIVIEGIIGSGKSTLVKSLSSHLRSLGYTVSVALEPVDEWVSSGLLQTFYDNKTRYAYLFQTAVFVDQTEVYQKAINAKPTPDYIIIERSLLSNTIFAELLHRGGSMTDLELRQYNKWSTFWHRTLIISPTHFIYLSPPVETAMSRLRSRGREGETDITADYQTRLKEGHDRIFSFHSVKYGTSYVPILQIADNTNLQPIMEFIR